MIISFNYSHLSGHPPYFRPRLWHRSFRVVLLLDAPGVCLISLLMFMLTINHPCSLLVLASSPSNGTRNTSPKRTATDLIMQVLNAAFGYFQMPCPLTATAHRRTQLKQVNVSHFGFKPLKPPYMDQVVVSPGHPCPKNAGSSISLMKPGSLVHRMTQSPRATRPVPPDDPQLPSRRPSHAGRGRRRPLQRLTLGGSTLVSLRSPNSSRAWRLKIRPRPHGGFDASTWTSKP